MSEKFSCFHVVFLNFSSQLRIACARFSVDETELPTAKSLEFITNFIGGYQHTNYFSESSACTSRSIRTNRLFESSYLNEPRFKVHLNSEMKRIPEYG